MGIWGFLLSAAIVLGLLGAYIGWRLIAPLNLGRLTRLGAWSLLAAGVYLPLLTLILRHSGTFPGAVALLTQAAYAAMGFLSMLFILLLGKDALWVVLAGGRFLGRRLRRLGGASDRGPVAVDPRRRLLLLRALNGGIVAMGGGMAAYGYYQAVRVPPVKRVQIPLSDGLRALDGFSIVQLTDLHITSPEQGVWLDKIVARVNGLRPDIIALTGDLADGHVPRLEPALRPLRKLQAPCGRYFVTGNHEYYWDHRQWMAAVERLDFTVLLNTRRLLRCRGARVLLAGVPDYNAGRFDADHRPDPAGAMGSGGGADFSILLAHQPRSIFAAAAAGFDLQLSGHTHGGQFFPWMLLVGLVHPFTAGLHRYGRTWIYTSRGTGYWGPPLRLGAPAEITQVILSAV